MNSLHAINHIKKNAVRRTQPITIGQPMSTCYNGYKVNNIKMDNTFRTCSITFDLYGVYYVLAPLYNHLEKRDGQVIKLIRSDGPQK